MLDFSSDNRRSAQVMAWSRLASLAILLAMVLGLIAYLNWLAVPEPDPPDAESDVAAERESLPREYETFTVVDSAKLAGFVDYAWKPDNESYYYLLDLAANNPPEKMREEAKDAAYIQLKDDPDSYRGTILKFEGRLLQLLKQKASKNEFGLVYQHEGYFYPFGWNGEVMLVVIADPPADVPLASRMDEPVEVVGYFLGWWRYKDARGKRVDAPILIASSIRSTRPPEESFQIPTTLLWVVGLGLIVLIPAAVWWFFGRESMPDPAVVKTEEGQVWHEPVIEQETTEDRESVSSLHQSNGDAISRHPLTREVE